MNKIGISLICLILLSCAPKLKKTEIFINNYDKIILKSYKIKKEPLFFNFELKIENNQLYIPKMEYMDSLELNKNDSKRIIDILFLNVKDGHMADCYNPRHILLFYKKDKLVSYYEFCAECGGCRKSENLDIRPICYEQGKELIDIFKEMKLKNIDHNSE